LNFELFKPLAVAFGAVFMTHASYAYEPGYPGWALPPGTLIGVNAGSPAPGLYGAEQVFAFPAHQVGPGAAPSPGRTSVHTISSATSLLWVPGWTVLGGTYDALIVQPFTIADAGAPINVQKSGMHNTVLIPVELSYKLGDSGFYVKPALGVGVPDGTITGANGLGSIGNPWWVFQPGVVASYLKDGWKLTANLSEEFNTKSTKTDYRTGNILHLELTGTHTFGSWTIGPVASYIGQVTNDQSSAFYKNTVTTNRYDIYSVGALVGYNFGPVGLDFWATKDTSATATNNGAAPVDKAVIPNGLKLFARLNFKIN
jgi:hypothetical protein